MAARPQQKVLADAVRRRQPYRRVPGGKVTYKVFDFAEDATRFGELVDKIGGQAAYEARTAITAHLTAICPAADPSWLRICARPSTLSA